MTLPRPHVEQRALPTKYFSPNNQPDAKTPDAGYFATTCISAGISHVGLCSLHKVIFSGMPYAKGLFKSNVALSNDPGDRNPWRQHRATHSSRPREHFRRIFRCVIEENNRAALCRKLFQRCRTFGAEASRKLYRHRSCPMSLGDLLRRLIGNHNGVVLLPQAACLYIASCRLV